MPRTLSDRLREQLNVQDMDDVFLWLLTIEHDTMTETIRVVNDRQKVISRGNEFLAYSFSFQMPEDDGETIARAQLTIDNVDRRLVKAVREITTPLHVTIEGVLASQPDTVEITISDILIREIKYNAQSLTGTLYVEDFLNRRIPYDTFNPQEYEGLFR